MTDNSDVRQLVHKLNNVFTRILTTAELIEPRGEADDQLAADARAIRDAALEGRDIGEAIRTAAIRAEAIRAEVARAQDAPTQADAKRTPAGHNGERPDADG
ncbi:MAG: hypothetical protein ACOC2D_00880 [Spirochaetota bacterium]